MRRAAAKVTITIQLSHARRDAMRRAAGNVCQSEHIRRLVRTDVESKGIIWPPLPPRKYNRSSEPRKLSTTPPSLREELEQRLDAALGDGMCMDCPDDRAQAMRAIEDVLVGLGILADDETSFP